jgi:hypothetical protein
LKTRFAIAVSLAIGAGSFCSLSRSGLTAAAAGAAVSFRQDVLPIFQVHCVSCHWRASPQLRMPHGRQQLPVGERDTIRTWIRQGAKDN